VQHHFIFIAGLHRSGTSLLHQIFRSHPSISGFWNTDVSEDEGQHLQTVFPPAKHFGGPGRFGFNPESFMDEHHPLATPYSAKRLFLEWGQYWDFSKPYLLEKSPPNIVRTRFLQCLFQDCSFVVILRHPIAVAYATQRWAQTSIPSLLDHTLLCYERFQTDMHFLRRLYVLRYEEFVLAPSTHLKKLAQWLGIGTFECSQAVRRRINKGYFASWRRGVDLDSRRDRREIQQLADRFSQRAGAFGYRMHDPEALDALTWCGLHERLSVDEEVTRGAGQHTWAA
jgi:Sulfotransferase family